MEKSKSPQTLSQQSPLETALDSFFFSIFTFERRSNHRKMCLLTSLRDIKQFHDPSFVSKGCYNFKSFQSDCLILFQNYPLNQHNREHQFWHFSTAKIPSWYMAFTRKNGIPEKEQCFPYQSAK